ncbi:glycosyltransferase family 2 protein [Planctomonas sp. JC2975]|uniref:glycosyltransferase n=1 Tax=Planctomonas sp. JC2975 TaxID=2729626 RepID=UPI0014751E70|nr:glycosyltransferase family 2 protein [Planctomonas sp. JC2975]
MSAELVSVIVPTHNGVRYLRHTLDSLSGQTYPDVEVIVVDDGSTDDTVAMAHDHPVRPQVLEQNNSGVAVARNRGLAAAGGDWVAFIDQDDLWHSERVDALLELAHRRHVDAVATTETSFSYASDRIALASVGDGREGWAKFWIADDDEDALLTADLPAEGEEEIPLARLLKGAAMVTTAVMYRRELAIAAGGCAPHARALDDHLLNLNVARIAGPITRARNGQLFYRVHSGSASTFSPMVGPFLSTQAALRLGGIFPTDHQIGSNIDHTLFGIGRSELSFADKLGLLLLTTPKGTRARWMLRWATRQLRIRR